LKHTGAEHQELQVAALADAAELPDGAAAAAHRHPAAELADGALVPDALSDAAHFRLAQGLSRLVLQPAHRHDRGHPRVQRADCQAVAQGCSGIYVGV